MICFMGKTFCGSRCANETCEIRLTPEVEKQAQAWWGRPGAPIAVSNYGSYCKSYQPLQTAEA